MKRSLLLAAFLTVACSPIFFLPAFKVTQSAMKMTVPDHLGGWRTQGYPPTEKERLTLAPDTEFSKAQCFLPRYEEASFITGETPVDYADLSIVLSGQDLTNSIHRPERCMPAQGHEIYDSRPDQLTLERGESVPIRRLLSMQSRETKTGQVIKVHALTYYFFVGHNKLTANHSERNLMDIKNRLLRGEAERWAYVSVTMVFDPAEKAEARGLPTLAMADTKIRNLLSTLSEENVNWKMIAAN